MMFSFLIEPKHQGGSEHGCQDCGKHDQPDHLSVPFFLNLLLPKLVAEGKAFADMYGIPIVAIVGVNEGAVSVAKAFLHYVELALCDAELGHHFLSVEMGVERARLGCQVEQCVEEEASVVLRLFHLIHLCSCRTIKIVSGVERSGIPDTIG
jgi:hypothetical protein